jgi:hypothetical protein
VPPTAKFCAEALASSRERKEKTGGHCNGCEKATGVAFLLPAPKPGVKKGLELELVSQNRKKKIWN